MSICMAGIDHTLAPVELRERFSLTETAKAGVLGAVRAHPGVSGCVVIGTCNRTELWLSAGGDLEKRPFELLCSCLGADPEQYARYFVQRDGDEAVRHLFELACGLKSLVFGEEQILSQVREAIAFARGRGAADPVLEALFRRAVTAGKRVRTSVRLAASDSSAAAAMVRLLKSEIGELTGIRCLVIGSGEMGALAARELLSQGCRVWMTQRRHSAGPSPVPAGCFPIAYEERYGRLAEADVVVSATRSPHFTLTCDMVRSSIGRGTKIFFDLAVPRDIDPKIREIPGARLYDIDALGCRPRGGSDQSLAEAMSIISEEIAEFKRWEKARELMPKLAEIRQAAAADLRERLDSGLKKTGLGPSELSAVKDAAEKAVAKVVENIMLGLQKAMDGDMVSFCLEELGQALAGGLESASGSAGAPPRFPLFVDLSGKKAVIVGAGAVASRRVQSLLLFPCRICVVAPDACHEIKRLAAAGKIELKEKPYTPSDLEGAFIVVAATDDRELNRRISVDAKENGQFCSVADRRDECTFFFPALVPYAGGMIGVCGTGEDHARTRLISAGIRRLLKLEKAV